MLKQIQMVLYGIAFNKLIKFKKKIVQKTVYFLFNFKDKKKNNRNALQKYKYEIM